MKPSKWRQTIAATEPNPVLQLVAAIHDGIVQMDQRVAQIEQVVTSLNAIQERHEAGLSYLLGDDFLPVMRGEKVENRRPLPGGNYEKTEVDAHFTPNKFDSVEPWIPKEFDDFNIPTPITASELQGPHPLDPPNPNCEECHGSGWKQGTQRTPCSLCYPQPPRNSEETDVAKIAAATLDHTQTHTGVVDPNAGEIFRLRVELAKMKAENTTLRDENAELLRKETQ